MMSTPTLASFHDLHAASRCFVVGSAPSLADLDLARLDGELAFTVNRAYLAAPLGLPVAPYHVVSDPRTYRHYWAEIRAAAVGQRFYRSDVCALPEYRDAPDRETAVPFPFHDAPAMDEGGFAEDATGGVYQGFTVVLDAIQLAFHMGCSPVYVIGCDLDYEQPRTHVYGTGALEDQSRGLMPVARVLAAMTVAARAFARHGRLLANAGHGGRLDVLPRVPFSSLF